METHLTTARTIDVFDIKGTRLAAARAELALVLNGRPQPAWLDSFATLNDIQMAIRLLAPQTSTGARRKALTKIQHKLVDMLLISKDVCDRADLMKCLKTPGDANLAVQMRNLQLVLLPHDIHIEPVKDKGKTYVGYKMPETSKGRARIVAAAAKLA